MRFAGNSSNVGSWIQAGKAGAAGAANFFKVARANAPDFGGMGENSIKTKSFERREVNKAVGEVTQAGVKALGDVKTTRIKTDSELAVQKTKLDARRKAGMVGMFGAAAGGLFMGMENKKADKRQAERDAAEDQREASKWAMLTQRLEGAPESPELKPFQPAAPPETTAYVIKPYESPNTDPTNTDTAETNKDTTGDQSSGGVRNTPAKSTGGMSTQFKKIYDLAVKDGRAKFPEIVAAQAMHETGHLSPDIKSVYNSSGGTNPFGQTGDRGYGTMTREGDSSGWSKFPDLQTAVSDHITLWHDTKNHGDNYNAHGTISGGLSAVIPAYSPNSDPANQKLGYTENAYGSAVRKILKDNGFDVK